MGEFGSGQLATFLEGHDVPCPGCGYNLRDLREGRCPECGDALVLSVGLAEPKQAAGITGLIGLVAGAGLSGLLLLYVLIRYVVFHDSMSGDDDAFLLVTSVGFVIEGAAACIWVARWRQIRRLPLVPKCALVLGCWALTLVNLVVFSVSIK